MAFLCLCIGRGWRGVSLPGGGYHSSIQDLAHPSPSPLRPDPSGWTSSDSSILLDLRLPRMISGVARGGGPFRGRGCAPGPPAKSPGRSLRPGNLQRRSRRRGPGHSLRPGVHHSGKLCRSRSGLRRRPLTLLLVYFHGPRAGTRSRPDHAPGRGHRQLLLFGHHHVSDLRDQRRTPLQRDFLADG